MGTWAISFGVLYFLALAINGVVSRLERNCGAATLSLAFVVAWCVTNTLRGVFVLPYAWIPAGVLNLGLLLGSLSVAKYTKARWPWAIAGALLIGLALQVALWVSWWPHRHEVYDRAQYNLFYRYWQVTTVLASLELACLFWPGGLILVRTLGDWADRLYGLPDRRRSSV